MWALVGLAFLVAGLELAAKGYMGHDPGIVLERLFRFIAFYVLMTLLPFYLGAWICVPLRRQGPRGAVMDAAVRAQARRLMKLRNIAAPSTLQSEPAARMRRAISRQSNSIAGRLQPLRSVLPIITLAGLGIVLLSVAVGLLVFGPQSVLAALGS